MKSNAARGLRWAMCCAMAALVLSAPVCAQRQQPPPEEKHPWSDPSLSPDVRADMVLKELTLDEKIGLLHGQGMRGWGPPKANDWMGNGGAGWVLGVPRLGIPTIQMSDAAYGVRNSGTNGRYSTALPSNVASASSWDVDAACEYGALIGRELRAQGFNMTLGGGVNITREPRNGRTFEYMGEDPILAGTLVGNRIKCEEAQHVIGDIKHYALNDQESGRNEVNVLISKRAMQESDLLAFHIGIKIGNPGGVMCSYNAINDDYACQNSYLLTDVLKKDWAFPGFVLSDWGGTHSTIKASAAGLDNEQPGERFFGDALKDAVTSGKVSQTEIDEHVRRILRSEFADGTIDYPMQRSVIDVEGGLETSRKIAEASAVLLKNSKGLLPLERGKVKSIAVIGMNADTGMISGGGSAQVDPPGRLPTKWQEHVWFPTSPLKAIEVKAPGMQVKFDSGKDPAGAAALAKNSDVAIVFAYQWESEGMDLPSLALPDNQDALIQQVAAANPRTIVVLETGTAVTMPWIDKVDAVLEAWYAGSKGADAVANLLFGDVNPTAKLPMTFPLKDEDVPHPTLVKPAPGGSGSRPSQVTGEIKPTFSVTYDEGLKVGYKWYDAENKPVLFPFGFGLSYTTYSYSGLKVTPGAAGTTVTFSVKNTGKRAGVEIAEVYAALPASAEEPPKRLVGWSRVALGPGESKDVTVNVSREYLSIYDEASSGWKLVSGEYSFMVGGSSQNLPLTQKSNIQ
ncbi:MAG: glycoside hydrolase family 3 C-terminal domain-containing protein [Candidatus Acidiferrales bacterium]